MAGRGDAVLTFVFTDIDGHTALWDADPESMSTALRDHDRLMTDTVTGVGARS